MKYNHAFTIAFAIVSTDPEGNVTAEELLAGLRAKLEEFESDPDQIVESAGAPYDSFEVEEEPEITPVGTPTFPISSGEPIEFPKLKTSISCEIDDLIEVVMARTGHKHGIIEKAMFDSGLYPECGKTCISPYGFCVDTHWVREIIHQVMTEQNIDTMYITEAI
jgi:hypothetical protein